MKVVKWYKFEYFWLRGDGDEDFVPGDRDDGVGDLIFNTASKIAHDKDYSDWAIKSFLALSALLQGHQRWINRFNVGTEAPNRWVWYPYKWTVQLLILIGFNVKFRWSRPQDDMTRDSYISFGACYTSLMLGISERDQELIRLHFEAIQLPWYLYRPNTWEWWGRFKNDGRKHYVKRLSFLRAFGVVAHYYKYYENDFYEDKTA